MARAFETLTADQCGCSEQALLAAKAIMGLDGLSPFRKACDNANDGYDTRAAVASWARRIDIEWASADLHQRRVDAQIASAREIAGNVFAKLHA